MSAPGPIQAATGLVSYTITANGQPLDAAWQIVSIDIGAGVNTLPTARIVIQDGSAADQNFPISETDTLIPGAVLTISLGYSGAEAPVFSGIVNRQGLEISEASGSLLIVDAVDPAIVMTLAPHNGVFENMTDSDLIAKLIGDAGLTASVAKSSVVQPAIVQYHASDWDLMLVRAKVNGMVAIASGGTVSVAPPDTSQSPVLTLTYGESILDFRADMDASSQYHASSVKSFAWDPAAQSVAESESASATVTTPGNISSEHLADVFGIALLGQQTAGTLDMSDLTTWSSARLTQSRLAKIRGECRFQGSALARPGGMVTLAGLGGRFNGDAYVSAVTHRVESGQWTTSVTVGLPSDWTSMASAKAVAPMAAGQIPAAANLQTGVVQQIDQDPDGEFRVRVSLPLLQASAGVWARLGNFYASNGVGAVFYPEIGDEVVVAFMNGDPLFPVIIGSLYSKQNPPPVSPKAKNAQKSIVTSSRVRIDIFDTDGAIEISTPGGQKVRLDDKAGSVRIGDRNGNSVTMAASGVTIDSSAGITLSAKTDVTIAAQGKVSLKGTAGVTLAGLAISANADTSFSASGAAEAKLISSGMTTIQGGLVKIN